MATTSWAVSDLIDQLEFDEWRNKNPFTAEIAECHAVLFDESKTRLEKAAALNDWLAEHQPCLFGRMEARQRRLPICLLTENDLVRSDLEIRSKIAEERTGWKRLASTGKSHGFLIVAVSERIAEAKPGETLRKLASRLCELYLDDGPSDTILHDDVMLEIETDEGIERRKWKVGANYFSSQGDGRWWRDHRIPGGMAFSMNSVGHMARQRAESMQVKNAATTLGLPQERLVYFALPTAMKTIGPPIQESYRGTWLAPHGTFEEDHEPPPSAERPRYFGDLAAYSENRYQGLYHTDQTIPKDYFNNGLWRKEDLNARDDLYFTYMHSKSDPDYSSMGLGELFEGDAGAKENDT